MNNSMVAHLWANEKQESAYGSNFYFEGESIYSYGRHFEVGRIVRNKRGEKAYLINDTYYSSTTSKHQYYVREAIPTGSKVFYVECNMSYCIGNMLFVTNMLESIKDAIEKYKKARTELSYRDIWETFKNLMDYIEFFDMGTPRRLLKKSANEWLGTNHELSRKSDKIKREYVRELKHIFQILLNHQALEVLGTVNVIVDEVCGEGTWIKYSERSERWRKGEEERERIKLERLREEKKSFAERIANTENLKKAGIIKQYLSEYEYLLTKEKKCDFKPFGQVLVRASNLENWNLHLFARVREEEYKYECLGGLRYKECIPYQGNEHLLGTNKSK